MKKLLIAGLVGTLACLSSGCGSPKAVPVTTLENQAPTTTKNFIYPYDEKENRPLDTNGISPEFILEETEAYHIAGYFPKTANPTVNVALKKYVEDSLVDFKNGGNLYGIPGASSTPRSPLSGDEAVPYRFITYSIPYAGPRLVSILFTTEEFTGGNHPGYFFTSKNFNLATGKELELKDIFISPTQALKKISTQALKTISEDTPPSDKTFADIQREGTAPSTENYAAFTFSSSSIRFQFQPYQTGSWADGAPEIEVPITEISQFLNPNIKSLLK